jgi:hypothetical protein
LLKAPGRERGITDKSGSSSSCSRSVSTPTRWACCSSSTKLVAWLRADMYR